MVARFGTNFSGGAELERALRGLDAEISGRLGVNATRAGARVLANEAKARAPVSTGALKASIRTFDDLKAKRAGGRERTTFVGSRLFYAYWVEFGTAFVRARSFLRAAADTAAGDAVDKLAQNLSEGIERETSKYG